MNQRTFPLMGVLVLGAVILSCSSDVPSACDPGPQAAAKSQAYAQQAAAPQRSVTVNVLGQGEREIMATLMQGNLIVEGDILVKENVDGIQLRALAISNIGKRWTNGEVPYTIASNLVNQSRVTSAIAAWEGETNVRFVPRTTQNNYVAFIKGNEPKVGYSYVGMQGGKQNLILGNEVGLPVTIHEIGHALGLYHEQSRSDRDANICILWDNIESGRASQFNKVLGATAQTSYDFKSIMHYHDTAFSKNGKKTIISRKSGQPVRGMRTISSLDAQAINKMYP